LGLSDDLLCVVCEFWASSAVRGLSPQSSQRKAAECNAVEILELHYYRFLG
jgi:hypothetical protein